MALGGVSGRKRLGASNRAVLRMLNVSPGNAGARLDVQAKVLISFCIK